MPSKRRETGAYHHGDLRAELLTAAVALAEERGIDGLSLRECARRAGVSHAAPYRHFEDKSALLSALAEQGFAWLAEAGRAAMEGLEDPRERLDAYGVAYVRFAVEHPIHFRLMFTRELPPAPAATRTGGVEQSSPDGVEQPSADGVEQPSPDDAFALLVATAGEARRASGEQALLAGVAAWCLPHGLAMLILEGRIPHERVATLEAVSSLAREVLASWRAAETR